MDVIELCESELLDEAARGSRDAQLLLGRRDA